MRFLFWEEAAVAVPVPSVPVAIIDRADDDCCSVAVGSFSVDCVGQGAVAGGLAAEGVVGYTGGVWAVSTS